MGPTTQATHSQLEGCLGVRLVQPDGTLEEVTVELTVEGYLHLGIACTDAVKTVGQTFV